MITVARSNPELSRDPKSLDGSCGLATSTFWGLSPIELHDRYWAGLGVQVIRVGTTPVTRQGPQLYFLLDQNDFVLFKLSSVIERLNWIKPKVLRLRITDDQEDEYSEFVECDSGNRLRGIRRLYKAQHRPTLRMWITADHRIAQQWSAAGCENDARRQMKQSRPHRGRDLALSVPGRIFNIRSKKELDEALGLLQARWHSINQAISGVFEYAKNIWVHESVTISPTARIEGPLWIGAGVHIRDQEILVGPGGTRDQVRLNGEVKAFRWGDTLLPKWFRHHKPHAIAYRKYTKRLFDIAFALIALAATAPLYPIIMVAIYLEDGRPFFFRHRRQTLGGQNFDCLKFRTMCQDAEDLKLKLQQQNRCDGPQFFIEDDPRLLRIGKLLRRFQLDELPQFWNVLIGDMSVVGPRPSPDKENQFCPTWREARLSVRPGVTGLWQIRRTREPMTDFQEWIRYDLEYVQRQGWRLDLWIIIQTVKKALFGEDSHHDEKG